MAARKRTTRTSAETAARALEIRASVQAGKDAAARRAAAGSRAHWGSTPRKAIVLSRPTMRKLETFASTLGIDIDELAEKILADELEVKPSDDNEAVRQAAKAAEKDGFIGD
jgi:hypothetical protein